MNLSYNCFMPEMNLEREYPDNLVDEMIQVITKELRPLLQTHVEWLTSTVETEALLTQAQAARYYGCSRKAISEAIKSGNLPAYTSQKMVLWKDVVKLKIKGKK